MGKNTSSEDNTTTNKGVNVHSESLPARVHRYPETETSSSPYPTNRPMTDVRNEIQNVLDLMGPTTITTATSSEADNEDSIMSIQNKSRKSSPSTRQRTRSSLPFCSDGSTKRSPTTQRDQSDSSNNSETNKDSLLADMGTLSTSNNVEMYDEFEHSCCNHAHMGVKTECICMEGYLTQSRTPVTPSKTCEGYYSTPNKSTKVTTIDCKRRGLVEWLKEKSSDLKMKKTQNPCELYKINICGQDDDAAPPKRVVFDLVDGIPRPTSNTVATNTIRNPVEKCKAEFDATSRNNVMSSHLTYNKDMKNMTNETIGHSGASKIQKNVFYDSDGNTRVDFYYFDHGNAQYFHTTDTPPVMKCEVLAEKTERYTTRFWAEVFASIHIGVSFCVSFILQLFKFLLYSILRPLCIGLLQMWSDYLFKPLLTTCFNGLIQPFLIFLYNIATSVRDLCDPIAEAFGYFCRELAVLFRAIRLCTYQRNSKEEMDCNCKKKLKCEC